MKVVIPATDSDEVRRSRNRGHAVGLRLEQRHRLGSGNRHGHDNARSALMTNGSHRSTHRCSRRQAIVYEHDRLARNGDRWSPVAVGAIASVDFRPLFVDDLVQSGRIQTEIPHDVVVQHHDTTAGDRADRQLRLAGRAELANHQYVERRLHRVGNLPSNRHATAGQSEDENVGCVNQLAHDGRQLATSFLPIRKDGPIMDLRKFQTLMRDTYGTRDRERGIAVAVAWLTEEVGELAQAVRKGTPAQQLVELADVLAWLASIAEQLDLSLDEASLRYADGCPRCAQLPCACEY